MLSGMVSSDPEDIKREGFRVPDISNLQGGMKGLRIGVVRHFYEEDPYLSDDVQDAMERSLSTFERLGARLSTVRLAEFNEYCSVSRTISWPEEYEEHRAELEGHPDRFTAITRSRFEDGNNTSAADYVQALKMQAILTNGFRIIMRDVDVLVLPTTKMAAQVLGYEHTPLGEIELSLMRPFDLTGGPSLALCNGFTKDGLPISIQIIGRHFEDDTVLQAGHALESALALRAHRPQFN